MSEEGVSELDRLIEDTLADIIARDGNFLETPKGSSPTAAMQMAPLQATGNSVVTVDFSYIAPTETHENQCMVQNQDNQLPFETLELKALSTEAVYPNHQVAETSAPIAIPSTSTNVPLTYATESSPSAAGQSPSSVTVDGDMVTLKFSLSTLDGLNLQDVATSSEEHSDLSSLASMSPSRHSVESGSPPKDEGSSGGGVCQVCGSKATKYLHYGTSACHSCRAFFRRAVDGNKFEQFKCKVEQNCQVQSKSWKSCKYCRFQRCLGAGMRASWVLSEEQKKVRSASRKGSSETTVACRSLKKPSLPRPFEETFTRDDFLHLKNLYNAMLDIDVNTCTKWLKSLGFKFLRESLATAEQVGRFNDKVIMSYKDLSYQVTEVMLENFSGLCLEEKEKQCLLKQNVPLLQALETVFLVVTTQNPLTQDYLKAYVKKLGPEVAVNKDAEVIIDLTEKIRKSSPKENYRKFYASPWAPEESTEKRHQFLAEKLGTWINNNTYWHGVDDTEIRLTMLAMLCMFSVDFIDGLKTSNRSIQGQQMHYGYLLHKYLKSKFGSERAGTELAQTMMILTDARELGDLEARRVASNSC